jgi:hypothetical protein
VDKDRARGLGHSWRELASGTSLDTEEARTAVEQGLSNLVPDSPHAAAIEQAGEAPLIAIVAGDALYRVGYRAVGGQPGAECRMTGLTPGRGAATVAIRFERGDWEGMLTHTEWTFELGNDETFSFRARYSLEEALEGPEAVARALSKALGCPLKPAEQLHGRRLTVGPLGSHR